MPRTDFLLLYFTYVFRIYIGGYPVIYVSLVFIESQLGIACIFISFSELQQQRIHIFMQAAEIFWQFTWHCIHHAPPGCSCRGFFVFWPTLQLETDDNKKLYYTQAHPFDLMAVECAAFNAGPGDGNELVGIGLSWVCFVGWWRERGWCQLCGLCGLCQWWPRFGPHFSLLGARELLII